VCAHVVDEGYIFNIAGDCIGHDFTPFGARNGTSTFKPLHDSRN
jgi:hypothetical protein